MYAWFCMHIKDPIDHDCRVQVPYNLVRMQLDCSTLRISVKLKSSKFKHLVSMKMQVTIEALDITSNHVFDWRLQSKTSPTLHFS